jgi:4-amino-4-deoxy-L-arabinose transferase-like glycosyltransferase
VLVVAAGVRLHGLGVVPPGLFCDEQALAVHAYSLGVTGRNLDGQRWPLYSGERSFEAWGSHGITYQPVFLYSAVPVVTALKCSPFSVRLVSVLWGLLGVLAAYLLAQRLLGQDVGLVAAALLAVSPWHHHFSRVAFEAISLPPLLAGGAYLAVRGLTQPRLLVAAAATWGLATYAYPPARLFVPLLALGLLLAYRHDLRRAPRGLAAAAVAFLVVVTPNLWVLATEPQPRLGELLLWSAEPSRVPTWALLPDTPWLKVPALFLANYLAHLSPSFLFLHGDANPRHGLPDSGLCHLATAPLLLAGLVTAWRTRREPGSRFLLFWMVTWPIPASLTIESPHAIRAITALPVLDVLAALGLVRLLQARRQDSTAPRWLRPTAVALAGVLCGEAAWHLHRYHRDYPARAGRAWQSGVQEAIQEAERLRGDSVRIVITPAIHNGLLAVLAFASVDEGAFGGPRDLASRLEPRGFHVLTPGAQVDMDPRDLWVITAQDLAAHPHFRVLARVPYPDGKPNLYVARPAPP